MADKKRKLSELIRAGARQRPQCFGNLFRLEGDGSTCALGAAVEGQFGEMPWRVGQKKRDAFLNSIEVGLRSAIISKNDDNQWSRERIARWLEEKGL